MQHEQSSTSIIIKDVIIENVLTFNTEILLKAKNPEHEAIYLTTTCANLAITEGLVDLLDSWQMLQDPLILEQAGTQASITDSRGVILTF